MMHDTISAPSIRCWNGGEAPILYLQINLMNHPFINDQGWTDPIPTIMIVSPKVTSVSEQKKRKKTDILRSFKSFVITDSSLLIPQQFIYCPTCAQNLPTHLPGIQISHSRCLWTSIFDVWLRLPSLSPREPGSNLLCVSKYMDVYPPWN